MEPMNAVAHRPPLIATDLEGILLPEIWIAVAERTSIPQLRLTTRDVADYDELMQMRLAILREHRLKLHDIQAVIATMDLLPGAAEFLTWLRTQGPLIIITDSFYQLLTPFMPKLQYATVFAHTLEVSEDGSLAGYSLRVRDGKRLALQNFSSLGFRTLAIGDSYNDIGMLLTADQGILYHPPRNVIEEFPELPVTNSYEELKQRIRLFIDGRQTD
jgi:phosphoserine / homoserine phosphotransferase